MRITSFPPATPLHGHAALTARFHDLSTCLREYRHLWEPRPFVSSCLAWEEAHPEVADWAKGLTTEEIDAIEERRSTPANGLVCPLMYQRWWEETRLVADLGPLPQTPLPMPEGMAHKQLRWRIPGRKWSQIVAFGGALRAGWGEALEHIDSLLDWCAGKGHVGRTLGYTLARPVWALERQAHLSQRSEEMAARLDVSWHAHTLDVLSPDAHPHLQPSRGAMGLHACGVLSHALLREGVAQGVQAFAASPCCPHFVNGATHYPPMSQAATAVDLPLSAKQLRLAIADEILAPPRERQRRRREMAFRLGLDLLWREATGHDVYHSAGNLPENMTRLSFEAFCEEVAALRSLPLPTQWSPEATEQRGWELAREARGRALIRALFRRPLELWLVMDRALYLAEHGYHVSLGTFCAADITPRNLMITATKAAHSP